jgi:hypothetical protein
MREGMGHSGQLLTVTEKVMSDAHLLECRF